MKLSLFTYRTTKQLQLALGLIAILTCLPVIGCGRPITVPPLLPNEAPQFEAIGNYPDRNYRIEPGDTLKIVYPFHEDMDQNEVVVKPDGKVNATQVGEIVVAGMTTVEVGKLLVERTADRLRNPEVVVSVFKFAEKKVYIAGEVDKPGTVEYQRGLTPLQAIVAAGGFRDTAMVDSVILIRPVENSEPLARKIDIAAVITDGNREWVRLAPHDVIFVPRTPIAEADLWVKQNLVELIPFFRGTGMSYGIGR